ncbi:MAG TPA: F0F1 ATP synthase subunit A [Longimicrobiaceae bacterium]|nr:F0F1 ATP synthase subunit A [Longimicrobiaceae bacterium]
MIASIAVLLTLAGAVPPQQAEAHAPAAPQAEAPHGAPTRQAEADEHAVETMAGAHEAEESHGAGGGIDFMHHIQDSREWELPFGQVVHFPPKGSWMVGPFDMTPTKHVLFLWISGALVLVTLLMGAALAARSERGRTAGKRHNAIEALVLFVRDEVVMPNVGHGGERYAPFICTLFFFILFANLLGLIPFGSTATANISVTAGLALITLVVAEIGGLIALGPKHYMSTIFFRPKGMNPVGAWTMAILLSPIELLGKFARPFALAIRLMANMTAGHIVLLAMISLIFVFGSLAVAVGPVLMAVAITFLELFVAFLQAFIFAVLTSVFIGLVRHAH